jgi:ABC-2 type transport system ATP-binding protein
MNPSLIVETENLGYSFNQQDKILDQIALQVPTGSIYGFLGPNGAGKTTTLRLLLGLLRHQTGNIFLHQLRMPQERLSILRQTGSLIEMPSLYAHLTAIENLRLLQIIYQCPKNRIEQLLKMVGLSDTGAKKTGTFSLGMKQRLGIAAALLHQPRLLILDEPTNWLDPSGIIDIRELLKHLHTHEGISILISSHLLAEIEKLVTHVGLIHKGQLLFQGTLQALQQQQLQAASIAFSTSNPNDTFHLFNQENLSPIASHDQVLIPMSTPAHIAQLNAKLVNQGIDVYGIQHQQSDLEDIFISLTK